MIDNVEMLNCIYQNAEMAKDNIMHMIKLTDDTRFRNTLENQLEEYEIVYKDCENLLKAETEDIKEVSPVTKMMSYTGSALKSLADRSPSNLADIVIQGSTMGITKLTKELHNYQGNDKLLLQLAEKELKTEQNNIEEMKKFL